MSATRVGVDVGGTFTDVILHGADGRATVRKLLSTPPAYDVAVVEAVGELAGAVRAPAEVVHGTTVATNAVLRAPRKRDGARHDEGLPRRPRAASPADAAHVRPLLAQARSDRRAATALRDRRARDRRRRSSCARSTRRRRASSRCACARPAWSRSRSASFTRTCIPAHERALGRILAEELPGVTISLSSEILREQREYERTATTVVNAYVRPLMSSYIDRIRSGLDGLGLEAPLSIMQSSGGVMTADDARARPVFALESGPAAGVVAALGIVRRLGIADAIAFDMGGTTAKASLIEDGAITRGREYEVGGSLSAGSRLIRGSGELLRIPTIDIAEVGAGRRQPRLARRRRRAAGRPAQRRRGSRARLLRPRRRRADRDRRERRARAAARRARSPTGRSRCPRERRDRGARTRRRRRSSWSCSRPPRASTGSRTRG